MIDYPCYIAGRAVSSAKKLSVYNPYTGEVAGTVASLGKAETIEDAIDLANSTAYGLSSGIVTNDMNRAIQAVKGIQTGTVNINQVPGYRIECSPFGGVKDSGLGVKEGVIEAMKGMTYVKTFSMPW